MTSRQTSQAEGDPAGTWTALLVDPTGELSQTLLPGMLHSGALEVVLAHSLQEVDELLGHHPGELAVVSYRFGANTDEIIRKVLEAGWDRVLLFAPGADTATAVSAFDAGATGLLHWPTSYAGYDPPRWARDLSDQEKEVLFLVAAGLSDSQISKELELSVPVVKRHLVRIGRLVGSGNRCQIITIGLRAGVLPPAGTWVARLGDWGGAPTIR